MKQRGGAVVRLTARSVAAQAGEEYPDVERPRTRGECNLWRRLCSRCDGTGFENACARCRGTGLEHIRVVGEDGHFEVHDQGAYQAWVESRASGDGRALKPCSFVSCRYHLYLEPVPEARGKPGIRINFAHEEPWELRESCTLDIADRGGATLEEVGHALNLTRERVRQIEMTLMRKVRLRVLQQEAHSA